MRARELIVDCDTGVDDALALLYLLADESVHLRAVTTVSGNVDALTAAHNTLGVLDMVGREDIPVAVGILRDFDAAPRVHGASGLGAVRLEPSQRAPMAQGAAEVLVAQARELDGELELLATGPLSTIAAALELEPRLPQLVAKLTVMGGAMLVPGNATAAAEANIHNDPEAAKAVFDAGFELVAVPLDVTMTERLTEAHLALWRDGGRVANFAADISEHYVDFYASVFGVRAAACHDPLAAAIAVGDVCATLAPRVHVDVDTADGPARGATIADLRGRFQGYPDDPESTTQVVLETNGDFGDRLTGRILAHGDGR